MLMKPDKNKQAATILAAEPMPMTEEPQVDVAQAAAEELIAAVHAKNAMAVAEAFKALMQLCEMSETEESEEA